VANGKGDTLEHGAAQRARPVTAIEAEESAANRAILEGRTFAEEIGQEQGMRAIAISSGVIPLTSACCTSALAATKVFAMSILPSRAA